jgi:CRP-like cAMP-binding protein
MNIKDFIKKNIVGYSATDFKLPFDTTETSFEKDEIVTDYGQIEDKVYFLNKGLVQVSILKDEEEKIVEFFSTGEFFCAYSSLLLQAPSDVQLITLTDCRVSVITRHELFDAYTKSLLASNLGLVVTQKLYLSRIQREKDFLTKPADIRYKELLERNPELIAQIPMNKVAKYLGIQPESLSRIKKSI